MPHAAIYQRPMRRPVHQLRVTVRTPEGREQYDVPATTSAEAKKKALALYSAEHDTPVAAWVEVH